MLIVECWPARAANGTRRVSSGASSQLTDKQHELYFHYPGAHTSPITPLEHAIETFSVLWNRRGQRQ